MDRIEPDLVKYPLLKYKEHVMILKGLELLMDELGIKRGGFKPNSLYAERYNYVEALYSKIARLDPTYAATINY